MHNISRDSIETEKAIITLKSRKKVPRPKISIERQIVTLTLEVVVEVDEAQEKLEEVSPELKKSVDVEAETSKECQPMVLSYAKFFRDLCTVKRKLNKLKDLGSPTISIMINESHIGRALLDLGSSVNLLPFSIYELLGLGEQKKTSIVLQLANRSVKINVFNACKMPSGCDDSEVRTVDVVDHFDISEYYQITIALEDQEKTNLTFLFGTYAFRWMPFGLCNAPATFQHCMMRIFFDICEEKNLLLNWKKCQFMVSSGLVLGHLVSKHDIEVDRAKVELISQLPIPRTVTDIHSFLGQAGFDRRFIQNFSSIAKPLCSLLQNETEFLWTNACQQTFEILTKYLTMAPIMQPPRWDLFEIMTNACDFALRAIFGQRVDNKSSVIYYANRTLNDSQNNYTTTEKELLAVVFTLEKFCSYVIGSPKFDITIQDKKRVENVVADHLSHLQLPDIFVSLSPLNDDFLDEHLFAVSCAPWFLDIVNYLVIDRMPDHLITQNKRKFIVEQMLLYDSKLHLFLGKLKSRWGGPYIVEKIHSHGAVEIVDPKNGKSFTVNGQHFKPFMTPFDPHEEVLLV
ncbi:uncharacterized protein LOC131158577 [Malania oleifera]|uniref:uncharacterized protein LOC131158577 n=1 Tax=Malania oleifera TaxID=397392 RepID=UPI0025ADFA2F|nr:uncharacterized protein LOC131158577 [Malania oleifera]